MLKTRFKPHEVFGVYRSAYKIDVPWDDILKPTVHQYLKLHEKAFSCPSNITMMSLISLTASMSGPSTVISTKDSSYQTSQNVYLMSICDPRGGKSATFDRVVLPVLNAYQEKHEHKIQLETYTSAGKLIYLINYITCQFLLHLSFLFILYLY
jgi:hypothetical protein